MVLGIDSLGGSWSTAGVGRGKQGLFISSDSAKLL
jgi:hypothetical protein